MKRHPGTILQQEYMEPLSLDNEHMALKLNVPQEQVELLTQRHVPVSAHMALRLAKCFNTRPQFWMNLQTAHDLHEAQNQWGADIDGSVGTV
jgi:antitoxin HigA-1